MVGIFRAVISKLVKLREVCFKREAMEEGYVEGGCMLLGSMEVNHSENPLWDRIPAHIRKWVIKCFIEWIL